MDSKGFQAASCALVAFLMSGPAGASGPAQRESFALPTTKTAPKIDGDLSDVCWKSAFKAGDFVRFTGNAPIVEQTEAWVTTDGATLYIAFICQDEHPELMRASETQRGSSAVEGDDHVTVVIDSQNLRRGVSSFSVNALGTQVEHLEGGTASNITWSGDWKAATKPLPDDKGWACEIAIPFQLLRHPAKSKAFGLQLARSLNREGNQMIWPALPPEGQSFFSRAQFLPELRLAQPMPDQRPPTVILPYSLTTASTEGARARQGVDVKYPFSTTVTGLLAVNPDFQTVEQDVANVNFSYNEQQVPDRRPFFAEGNEFLPSSEVFYSRRIGQFDQGLKVVGREGPTSIGLVSSQSQVGEADRTSGALALRQAVGLFSEYGVYAASDNRADRLSNRVVRASGTYGWVEGSQRNSVSFARSQSWQGGVQKGGAGDVTLSSRGAPGRPRYRLSSSYLSEDFITDLGLVQDRNRQGWSASMGIRNQLDRGRLLSYDVDCDYTSNKRLTTGDFFNESISLDMGVNTRDGFGLDISLDDGRRQQDTSNYFRDRLAGGGFSWNQRTLFQGGGLRYRSGTQGGQPTRSLSLAQGFLVSKPFSIRTSYSQQQRGGVTTQQVIATGTYRIDTLRAISARLLSQNGTGNAANVGAQTGTNFYMAFSQRSRRGTDFFLLLGDPNAARTTSQMTVKVTRPY
jgi:hypothetical protein